MPVGGTTVGERMRWCDREVQKIQKRLTSGVSPRQAERLATRLFRVAAWQRSALTERDRLIQQWLPLVRHVANNFKAANPGLSLDDLVSAGHVGLVLAAENFLPGGRATFKVYAYKAIWSHIVKECVHQRSLISLRNHRATEDDNWASPITVMNLGVEFAPQLPAPERHPLYEVDDFTELAARLAALPPRMREALERRYLDPDQGWQTLPQVAEQMGICVERVRQLIASALNRLRVNWPGLEDEDEPHAKAG